MGKTGNDGSTRLVKYRRTRRLNPRRQPGKNWQSFQRIPVTPPPGYDKALQFIPSAKFRPTAEIITVYSNLVPCVEITPLAAYKMWLMADYQHEEIGWYGTVEQIKTDNQRIFRILDVFMVQQEVTTGTTVMDIEGMNGLAQELLTRPDGVDIWNQLHFWGHSHGMLGVFPSGRDDDQMLEYQTASSHFVRGICNRSGDFMFCVYLYDENIAYHRVPWEIMPGELSEVEKTQIATDLKTEIAAKVTKRVYEVKPYLKGGSFAKPTDVGVEEDDDSLLSEIGRFIGIDPDSFDDEVDEELEEVKPRWAEEVGEEDVRDAY